MKKNSLFFFSALLYICFINNCIAQCELIIHQIGIPSDTLIIANYEENEQPVNINDSTLKFTWNQSIPDRLAVVLDRKTRWWTRVWMEPGIKQKIMVIDYNQRTATVENPSEWDKITEQWSHIQNKEQIIKADSIAMDYIEKNPSSYLSLYFLSHGTYRDDPAKKISALEKLGPELRNYPEYRQAKASLLKRNYPNIGDTFKEFILAGKNDSLFNSAGIKDKWILLNFWSNGCGPCVKEMDEYNDLYKSVDPDKVVFISIALDEDKSKWKKAPATNKMMWTSLWTENNTYCELCLHYNVFSMPFFILFDNEKKIFYIKDGAGELENIKATLKEKNLLK